MRGGADFVERVSIVRFLAAAKDALKKQQRSASLQIGLFDVLVLELDHPAIDINHVATDAELSWRIDRMAFVVQLDKFDQRADFASGLVSELIDGSESRDAVVNLEIANRGFQLLDARVERRDLGVLGFDLAILILQL